MVSSLVSTARSAFSRNEVLRPTEMNAVANNQSWLYQRTRQAKARYLGEVTAPGTISSGWIGLTKRFDDGGSRQLGLHASVSTIYGGAGTPDFELDVYASDKTTLLVTGALSSGATPNATTPFDTWGGSATGYFLFDPSPDPGDEPLMLYWELRATTIPGPLVAAVLVAEPQISDHALLPR